MVTALYMLTNLAYVYALDPTEMAKRTQEEVRPVAALATRALFGEAAAGVVEGHVAWAGAP